MRPIGMILICIVALLVQSVPAQADGIRKVQPLDSDWLFMRSEVSQGGAVTLDTKGWQKVELPHSYNVNDISDSHYYRGPTWYRRALEIGKIKPEERRYIEFDGAALASDLWVNGKLVGRHEGGFARFRFDLTPYLASGKNLIAVRVDNSRLSHVAPLNGDFTMFGGIYRSVRLVTTSDVHFDMLDYGGPGVYLATPEVSEKSAMVTYHARISNETDSPRTVTVKVALSTAKGQQVREVSKSVTLAARTVTPVDLTLTLDNPRLWQGVEDPYLYVSEAKILSDAQKPATLDQLTIPTGLRQVVFDADKGLILNGKLYKAHGVNLHNSARPGKGTAVGEKEVDEDFAMLADLGVTALRLAHYQHTPYEYILADQKGYVLWTEAPIVSEVDASQAFLDNAIQQTRELIRQTSNHASVIVWGIGNEIYKTDEASNRVLDALNKLVHDEDPSRPTVYANCCGPVTQAHAAHTDVLGSNVYFGWYSGQFSDLAKMGKTSHDLIPKTPWALSEYGAGGSVIHQEDPPRRPKTTDVWHPEQYQTLYHEAAWRQIRDDMPYLWGSFVWVGFDFSSAGRTEGDTKGINDKGLITFDRKVKKDSYFWYQANWAKKPMVYITSRRNWVRKTADVKLKVYSNQSEVRLILNGKDMGTKAVDDHIALWDLPLKKGRNTIKVITKGAKDQVDWVFDDVPAKP